MLGDVLLARAELRGEAFVLRVVAAARDRARHRLRERMAARTADEQLGRGAGESRAAGARTGDAARSRRSSASRVAATTNVRPRRRMTASAGTRNSRAGSPDQAPCGSRSGW